MYINKNILSLYQIDYIDGNKYLNYKCGFEIDIAALKKLPFQIRTGINYIDEKINNSIGIGLNIATKKNLNIVMDYALSSSLDDSFNHLFTLTFYKK